MTKIVDKAKVSGKSCTDPRQKNRIKKVHVAVCCSVLQSVAVFCSVLQSVAVCCSVLQCLAVCCGVLQCVAVFKNRAIRQ